jgi:hypothetical protein
MATLLLLVGLCGADAYRLPMRQATPSTMSRRDWVGGAAAAAALTAWAPLAAQASGGATAGKTTSIPRAKVRYYGRMAVVLNEYGKLGKVIDSGDAANIKKAGKAFWRDDDDNAPAAELKAAGYLLAVAFKIDSKIPPDKIAAVKDHKAMMASADKLKAAMNSGKPTEAAKAYAAATAALNVYLETVELPAIGDPRYDHPETACFFQCGELPKGSS